MPQMAPLNWLVLFIMFCSTFLVFNTLNYFSFNYPVKIKTHMPSTKKINWKW
uniref:ATP synthase complex subunit 8 n=1 Tax=Adoretus sp. ADO01 TaxID=1205533 RepID=A0A0S2MQ61_9SCAR|nr:ATP synthase F0 subunit 8 [Adoretus sp. ADO01]